MNYLSKMRLSGSSGMFMKKQTKLNGLENMFIALFLGSKRDLYDFVYEHLCWPREICVTRGAKEKGFKDFHLTSMNP